jgi:tRNA (cytidine/uridine-2'-O-)-methyltransferase
LRLALYEPDIPQNTGALLRLAAALGVPVDLIEPCGFLLDDRRLKRAGLDYLALVWLRRHTSWTAFIEVLPRTSRLVLLTTSGDIALHEFAFAAADTILLGRESAGVPADVHRRADARVAIPLQPGARSLNVALAGAVALAEALRQTAQFPAFRLTEP